MRDLPITHIKIDRSFITPMIGDSATAAIVKSTIALAHGLGRSVIAEGIETIDQLERLAEYDCDEAQGFYLGRPQPPADIENLLDPKHNSHETRPR